MPGKSFPNSGSLFVQTNTNPKAPGYSGDVDLDHEILEYLNGQMAAGQPLKLRIAGWKRVGTSGKTFLSLKVSSPQMPGARPSTPQARGPDLAQALFNAKRIQAEREDGEKDPWE